MSLSSSTRTSSQGSRATGRPAGGGSTRLPSGRERRPALAALAVILILLGAAGSALIALNSGNRSDFVAISAGALPPGHRIEPKDFSRGDLAGATGGLVPWSEAGKYVGRYTTSWLYKDQFVTPENFTKDGQQPIPQNGALVGVSLDAGHAPSDGLSVGDIVQVVRVPGGNDGGGNSTLLVGAAMVTSSAGAITDSKTSANSSLNVTILVPQSKVNLVAAAAAAKTLSVAKLAPGTKTDVASGGSN
ncbi:hypothetical protein JOF29_008639 [Kribbella aluminosa]|uniref:SAF domain-containing protein n=1 Tax=Kribbella aluminosa TaxID=416017 RepID=A0ABS4V0T8_9ACTN|nr:hypothetical protein [Kribbella aluminosa]MBP2357529.1 hypothetical protein [Kribbella aluminosa]